MSGWTYRTTPVSPAVRALREQVQKELRIRGGEFRLDAASPGSMYVGSGSYTGQMVPDLDQGSETRPDMHEYGAPGTAIFAGIIYGEEYNPDFQWREAVRIYDQMRRNDYQVYASLLMTELPILAGTWKIEPANDDPQSLDIASFVETALFHELDDTWTDTLRHALLCRAYGFMVTEQVWKVGQDGMVYWSKFAPRLPKTIWRWWIDENNELVGVQQWTFRDYTYKYLDIPASKLVVHTHRQEGNNFEGNAVLRTAYKPWYYKEILLRLMGIGFEREHVGVPVITLPKGHTAGDVKRAQAIGKNLRSNEQAYVTLPETWALEWLGAKQSRSSSHTPILDAIALLDIAISRNVLAQSMNLGSTETGAYNVAEEQDAILMQCLQSDADQVAATYNNKRNGAIPQLVKFNYDDPGIYPQLVCHRLKSLDVNAVITALGTAARGGLVTTTPDIEDYVREVLGIPSAPQSVIEATKLGGAQLQAGIDPATGQPLDPNAQAMQQAQLEHLQAQTDAAKSGQSPPGAQQDPRGIDRQRSKGPGQDDTLEFAAAERVPEGYRTPRYLGQSRRPMSQQQRRVYARMVRTSLRPYRMLTEAEWARAELAARNRMTPDHPGHDRLRQVVSRRLRRTYRDLEADLVADGGDNPTT